MSVREGPVTYDVEAHGQIWKRHADRFLDQRGHMAEQPATSITGPSDPGIPHDLMVSPEISSRTSTANSETSLKELDSLLEDSEETSGSVIPISSAHNVILSVLEGLLNDSNQVLSKNRGMWCMMTLICS